MPYPKRTVAILLGAAVMMIFCGVSCQQTHASPSPSKPPVATPVSPSTMPTPMGEMKDVQLCPGCHGNYRVLPGNQSCPPLPACELPDPRVRPLEPAAIDEARYEKLAQEFQIGVVSAPVEALGGLKPALALAQSTKTRCAPGEGLAFVGGRLGSCRVLLAEHNGQIRLLDTPVKFLQVFAPVESAEEALAFAVALHNAHPLYAFDKRALGSKNYGMIDLRPEFRYYAPEFVPTTVKQEGSDYLVNLFSFQQFGCGPHPYFAVSYRVTAAGTVTETSRTRLFEDPHFDDLCVD